VVDRGHHVLDDGLVEGGLFAGVGLAAQRFAAVALAVGAVFGARLA